MGWGQNRQGDPLAVSASLSTQARQCLLDLPAPLGPALQLQTLAKRAPGKSWLVQADMKGTKLQKCVGVGFVDRQNALDSLPRVIPAALKIGLHGISKQPLDFLAETLRMAQPDPPERVGEAGYPGQDRQGRECAAPPRGEGFDPDPAGNNRQVKRGREQYRQYQSQHLLTRPDLRQARPDGKHANPCTPGHVLAPSCLFPCGSPGQAGYYREVSEPDQAAQQPRR